MNPKGSGIKLRLKRSKMYNLIKILIDARDLLLYLPFATDTFPILKWICIATIPL